MGAYQVKAKVVKVSIGSLEGNRVARVLRSGAIVPDGVPQESLDRLEARGLIEELQLPEAIEPAEEENSGRENDGDHGGGEQGGGEQPPAPPAKSGQGSGAEAWRTYAEAVGVEIDTDADRAEVIAALEAAGKPTE